MMGSNDRDYFLKRAGEEEQAALAATSLKARWIHEEMATLYRAMAHALGPVPEAAVALPPEDAAA